MRIIALDAETFWSSKDYTLSKMGPVEYIRDGRFRAQLLGVDDGELAVYQGEDIAKSLSLIDWVNDMVVGHNAGAFDWLILSERYGIHPRWGLDTIFAMRWCGLSRVSPETHKALTALLGNGVKQDGTVVSDTKQWPDDFTPEEQKFFVRYCSDDTSQCRKNFVAMLPYLTDDCLRFMALTTRMATEPVFVLDTVMLEEYLKQLDAEAEEARQKIMSFFHFNTVADMLKAMRSKPKFAEMLRQLGVEPPMKLSEKKSATAGGPVYDYAFAKTDIEFLDLLEHEDPRVRLLVEIRLEMNSSILRSRCETLLKFAHMNKPLPIMLSCFKAHTGRYSAGTSDESTKSDGTNPQNLSKRNPAHLVLRKSIKVPQGMKVVACDSSQVEARVLAYVAGQQDLLQLFAQGADPYAELATNFGNNYTAQEIHDGAKAGDKEKEQLRFLGKTFVLSAGYGVGAAKAARKIWQDKVKLSHDYNEHESLVKTYLDIYRSQNSNIKYFWKVCGNIIKALCMGGTGKFGGPNNDIFEYGMMQVPPLNRQVPSIKLPNGYILRYPNLRAEDDEYLYDMNVGKRVVTRRLYGGKLTENLIQSLAFAVLIYQACRMDEDRIELKCNIHDSWATVVPEVIAEQTGQRMQWHMKQTPLWLQGCPLDAEYKIGDTFEVC